MDDVEMSRQIRDPIVRLGGAFMSAPELDAEEDRLGVSRRFLYFRGRAAVLGDPGPPVVTSLFGIFPSWLIELAVSEANERVSAQEAKQAYARACAAWASRVLAELDPADATAAAAHLLRVCDHADLTGMPLAAGWRHESRPQSPFGSLGHALMLAREVRGGLHFAALRSAGLSVTEAIALDPAGGRGRLERTGWPADDIEALQARVARIPDGPGRWRWAEERTDDLFGALLVPLDHSQRETLVRVLREADEAVPTAA